MPHPDHVFNRIFLSATPTSISSPTIASISSTSSPTKIGSSPTSPLFLCSPLTNFGDSSHSEDDQDQDYLQDFPEIFIINTQYDPSLESNRRIPDAMRGTERENFTFTEGERRRAKNAIIPKDLGDLEIQVFSLFYDNLIY